MKRNELLALAEDAREIAYSTDSADRRIDRLARTAAAALRALAEGAD
jgi:hypothetical protein